MTLSQGNSYLPDCLANTRSLHELTHTNSDENKLVLSVAEVSDPGHPC
ncbi:MAG: hypothetical protein BMS9Abin02_0586 [Anaerolineae bacterium]|nr:MAG: hypothetical protein BMS9Abin02_0586 [Anaerolineae bacterium]